MMAVSRVHRQSAPYSSSKVKRVMGEFAAGELHSGSKHGPKVTNRSRAIAIGISEARKARKGKR